MFSNVMILVALWGIYFAIHSALASLSVKRWVQHHQPAMLAYYRIAYNALATLLLIIPVGFTIAERGEPLWQWQGYAQWLANALALLAVVMFFWTLRYYDMREFMGIKQNREQVNAVYDQERFTLSPVHRFVRHPWYFLGLVIIWTRDMDYLFLTTAVIVTLYLVLGARLEEKKLVAFHGEVYRRYCQLVPGLIPRPWRYLSRAQAAQLQSGSAHTPYEPEKPDRE